MQTGLIGYGAFGQLLSSLVASDVVAYDPAVPVQGEGVKAGSLAEVCASDVVVFCVPVQHLCDAIQEAAPLIKEEAWVLDVASVKVRPAEWMRQYLPAHVDITCTHPLFGPQSAARGLAGQKLVICPIRGDREAQLQQWAEGLGLQVVYSDPETHDREMAHVQALTHLIGRALVRTGRPDIQLRTQSYQHLRDLASLIEYDSDELFAAIQSYNPFAAETVASFQEQLIDVLAKARR